LFVIDVDDEVERVEVGDDKGMGGRRVVEANDGRGATNGDNRGDVIATLTGGGGANGIVTFILLLPLLLLLFPAIVIDDVDDGVEENDDIGIVIGVGVNDGCIGESPGDGIIPSLVVPFLLI
jgi:hypothetical protein